MARGYPEPKRTDFITPDLGLDPSICFICKKAPARHPGEMCAACEDKFGA